MALFFLKTPTPLDLLLACAFVVIMTLFCWAAIIRTSSCAFNLGWYQQSPLWVHDVDPAKDKKHRDPGLIAKRVLAARPDFMAERSELEMLLADRGHILVMSPKCHPELAGQGVEYSWGVSKMHFRRNINLVPAKFHDNVMAALAIVDRRKCFMFERRAREYRNVLKDPTNDCYEKVEACRKTFKTHRNCVDYESKFLRSTFEAGELV
eukprot:SAG22_NODE_502_length_9704_cov_23.436439_4_plen_208_part_00